MDTFFTFSITCLTRVFMSLCWFNSFPTFAWRTRWCPLEVCLATFCSNAWSNAVSRRFTSCQSEYLLYFSNCYEKFRDTWLHQFYLWFYISSNFCRSSSLRWLWYLSCMWYTCWRWLPPYLIFTGAIKKGKVLCWSSLTPCNALPRNAVNRALAFSSLLHLWTCHDESWNLCYKFRKLNS